MFVPQQAKGSKKETLLTTLCDRWFYKFNNEGVSNKGWGEDSLNYENRDFLKFKNPKVLFAVKGNAVDYDVGTASSTSYYGFKLQMLVEDEGKLYTVESNLISSALSVDIIKDKYSEWDDPIGKYLRNIMIKPTEKEYDTYKKYYMCGFVRKYELKSENLILWQDMSGASGNWAAT